MCKKSGISGPFLLAAFLAIASMACDNGSGGLAKMARLTMKVEMGGSRSILPVLKTPLSYRLSVSSGPSTVAPLLSADGSFSLQLQYGIYDFHVEGFDGADASGNLLCSGGLTARTVDSDSTIVLRVSPLYEEGTGSASLTLFWPRAVGATKAQFACLPLASDPAAPSDPVAGDWVDALPSAPAGMPILGHRASYSNASLAAGDYVVHYRLWKGSTILVSESRSLQIAKNLTSSATIGLGSRYFGPLSKLSSRQATTALLKEDGKLWTWGSDQNPLRGIAATSTVNPYPSLMPGEDWFQVDYSSTTAAGIKADGSLWLWGYEQSDWPAVTPTPVQFGSDKDWMQVSMGHGHVLALKTDGSIWGLGHNYMGQLGLGDTLSRQALTRIGQESDWVEVYASSRAATAIKADGSLWTWGDDDIGLIGDGAPKAMKLNPQRLGSDSDWATVYPGSWAVFAQKNDGSLYSWGSNNYWQLGLGDTTNRTSPVRVGSGTNWVHVAIGVAVSAAIQSDGTLWTWGEYTDGALGNGLAVYNPTYFPPTRVGGDSDWVDAAAGDKFAMARKADGRVYVWGTNDQGQLGDGTFGATMNKLVPSLNGLSSFSLAFDFNGASGTAPDSRTLRYNETTSAPAAPSWPNHNFLGWYSDAACTLPWDFATSRVLGPTTLRAKWELVSFSPGLSVLLESPAEESISLGANQTLSRSGTLSVSVAETFSAYRWYVDGGRISGQAGKNLSIAMSGYAAGKHNLTVLVQKGLRWYSKNLNFILTE